MKLYFDIDGVLLGRVRKPANHVSEFLKTATERHDCYWATTHCKGEDTDDVKRYMEEALPMEIASYCEKINPTKWSHHKTEIFDYTSDFLWFEDAPFELEKEILKKHRKLSSLVIVDLINNPDQLRELVKLL